MTGAQALRSWLGWRIALAGVLPLAAVGALVFGVVLPQLRADIAIRSEVLARAIVGQVETHLVGAARELAVLAYDLRDRDRQSPAAWFAQLDAHVANADVFAAIYVCDDRNRVHSVGLPPAVRASREDVLGLDLSRRLFVSEARQRAQRVWSTTFLSTVTGRLTVGLAIPLQDDVLVAEIALDGLSEFLGRTPVANGMVTMILDAEGQIVAHSLAALSGQQLSLAHLPIVRDALRGQPATRDFVMNGEAFVGTPVRVPELGWIVLVAQPRTESLRPFLSTVWVLAIAVPLAVALAFAVAFTLARGLAKRMHEHALYAHAIAEGNYTQPRPVSRIVEFDSLGADLKRMSGAIEQRERDLANSEWRYRWVIGNAPIIIFELDQDGLFTLCEGRGLGRVGQAPGAVVGRSVFHLYSRYPTIGDHVRRALAGEALQFSAVVRNVFFEIALTPARAPSAGMRVIGVAVDLTERQRAEQALQRSETQYRRLYESMRDAVVTVDMRGVIREANSAFQQMLGYSDDELRHFSYRDLTPEKWHAIEAEVVGSQVLARGYSEVYEKEYRRKDGTIFPVELRTILLRDSVGEAVAMWAIVRDISERKRAEEALKASEALLAKTTADAPAMIHQFLLRPDGLLCFPYASAWCREMFGVRPETLKEAAAPLLERILPEDRRDFHESVASSARTLALWRHEFRLHSARGDVVWLQGISRPEKRADGSILWSGILFDTTDRKRAEEELQRHREHLEELVNERTVELRQAMQQLMQADKLAALGNLVAGLAHELNTPLGNARVVAGTLGEEIRAFAAAVDTGSLRRSQVTTFLERTREAVDLLERNAQRAAELIGQFKQVAVDQASVRRRRFVLRDTVSELLTALQPQFRRSAHRVEIDIPPELALDSYPGPLGQVLANLVGNSLTHGFAGTDAGVIRIRAQSEGGERVRLEYTDNGVGIPGAVRKRIFEPFFTTGLGSGGSGLGLYVAYNLVSSVLGGTIEACDADGPGVRFVIMLPCQAPDSLRGFAARE